MIYLFSGTPGSGKSLHQASEIITFFKRGRPVIANYEVNQDYIKKYNATFTYVNYKELTPQFLIDYSVEYFKTHKFREGCIKLFIDECQLMFNAREWNAVGRDKWLSFFTQHRKYGFDIYLIAQFDKMVDKMIRSLIEYEYIHRKVSNYGIFGWIVSLLCGGKLFVSVEMWYPLKQKISSSFFIASKKQFKLYDSYNTFTAK